MAYHEGKGTKLMQKFTMSEGRLERIAKCLQKIKDRSDEDVILEFGVFEGYSISEMLKFLTANNMSNKVIGFDSFQGLPKDEGVWGKGQFSSTYEITIENIKEVVSTKNLTMIKGFFSESLTPELKIQCALDKASLIHVDSDLYESCCQVLGFCKDLLKSGTFIIFDEWDGGEGRSWDEFATYNNIKYDTISYEENQMIVEIL